MKLDGIKLNVLLGQKTYVKNGIPSQRLNKEIVCDHF